MTASKSSLKDALELLQATSHDLVACGPAVAHLLSRLAKTCLRPKPDASDANAAAHLSETLRKLADDKLNSFPYHAVPTCWRRLYTDAVLYGAVAQLASSDAGGNATQLLLLQTIGRLDLAIVISGCPGPMRLELAQSLISLTQHQLAAAAPPQPVEATSLRQFDDEDGSERPAKRLRTTTRDRSSASPSSRGEQAHSATTETRSFRPPYIHIHLRELPALPTFLDPAHNSIHREPFIVRRGAAHFPAFDGHSNPRPRTAPSSREPGDDDEDGDGDDDDGTANEEREAEHHSSEKRPRRRSRWSDLTYLRQLAGPGRIVPVEVGGDYTQSEWGQRMMPFDEFLESLEVVEETGTGREEEDGESAASQNGREVSFFSIEADGDDQETGGGGGGGGGKDSNALSTRGVADPNAHEADAATKRQSSPPSTITTAAAASAESIPKRPIYYLAQHSLFRQFPALVSDLLIPDLVYSPPEQHYPFFGATATATATGHVPPPSPPFSAAKDNGDPSAHGGAGAHVEATAERRNAAANTDTRSSEAYLPPQSEEGYVLNAWLGPGGTKSAAHTDPWWNCYVQMAGWKWVWVAPPECGPYMAAFGKDTASDAGDSGGGDGSARPNNSTGAAEEYMTNTSSLDVTLPPPSSDSDNKTKPGPSSTPPPYPPQFLQHVLPHARQAVLDEGDVLVMPPRWWHAMVGLETSFSVSMWF